MRSPVVVMLLTSCSVFSLPLGSACAIDGRVTQVRLPAEDITLFYVEAPRVFTVRMQAKTASVEGKKLYIGDGEVAIDLVAHPLNGIFLQGVKYRQGDQFKNGTAIRLRPGHKMASDLKPGDVYVTLPGISFVLPESKLFP